MNATRYQRLITVLLAVVLLAGVAGCSGGGETARYQSPAARDPAFAMLDDYGSWIDLTPYGPVWSPWVTSEWRPFTYGHWAWSYGGWVWVGYEPFSWVVDHYGFWNFDRREGWIWIPGYEWSAANVSWISTDEYFGWAPLPPSGVLLPLPGDQNWEQLWVVIPAPDFANDNVGHYRTRGEALRGGSKIRGGERRSPDPREIERRTGKKVRDIQAREEKIRGGGRELVRLSWPPDETQRVEAHADTVKREVLRRERGGKEHLEPEPRQAGDRDVQKVAPPQPVKTPVIERKKEEKNTPPRLPDRVKTEPEKPLQPVVPPKSEPPKEVKKVTKKPEPAPVPAKPEKKVETPAPNADEPKSGKKDDTPRDS